MPEYMALVNFTENVSFFPQIILMLIIAKNTNLLNMMEKSARVGFTVGITITLFCFVIAIIFLFQLYQKNDERAE